MISQKPIRITKGSNDVRIDHHGDLLVLEQPLERDLRLVARVVDLDLLRARIVQRGDDLQLARVEDDLLDRARVVLHELDQLRVGLLRRRLRLGDERLARQVDEQDDHDQGEERAAKETVHWLFLRAG
jgi:hypothetical protein